MKHEWRKKEKALYLPKTKPEIIDIPKLQFITLSGEGNPNNSLFSKCIETLYSMAYAIKMNHKKTDTPPQNYQDWTVYPLEGIWDIKDEAKKNFDGNINKDDLVFDLMIRQPDFVGQSYFQEMLELTKIRKPNPLLERIQFNTFSEGKCIQMMHIGNYDNEPKKFRTNGTICI